MRDALAEAGASSFMALLAFTFTNIQPVRRSMTGLTPQADSRRQHSAVPIAGILDCAFLIAKVGVDQAVSFGVALCPLEVVEKCPGVGGANPSSIGISTG